MPVLLADVIFMAVSRLDLIFVVLVPFLSLFGPFGLPLLHLGIRCGQWMQGCIPFPKHASHYREIDKAVSWAHDNKEFLENDGRFILCGYSSGGNCASLYALSQPARRFHSIVMVSAAFLDTRTEHWTGLKAWFAPIFNAVFSEVLGINSTSLRESGSPLVAVKEDRAGEQWYILNARSELMGMPGQDILFDAEPFCKALKGKGAEIHRVTCGLNHWSLIFSLEPFVSSFCGKMLQ